MRGKTQGLSIAYWQELVVAAERKQLLQGQALIGMDNGLGIERIDRR